MIAKVEIENFQSHKKTVMEFVPGTNVIIGESDAGKSAVFRAIRWVAENRPLGDGFRSEWGGDTSVTIYTSEGNTIQRIRTASKNEYILNGQALEAFGSGVPEEVVNVLQMDSASIQAQKEPSFLLDATPGEAARMLNKAASIDDIDRTISGIKKSYNSTDSRIKHSQNQINDYQEKMKQYETLPIIESRLEEAETLEKERKKKEQFRQVLRGVVGRARDVSRRIEGTDHIPEAWGLCTATEEQLHLYQGKLASHEALVAAVKQAREIEDLLQSTMLVEEASPILQQAEAALQKYRKKRDQINSLKLLLKDGQKTKSSIAQVQKNINEIEREFHTLSPEACPLCGALMKSRKVV